MRRNRKLQSDQRLLAAFAITVLLSSAPVLAQETSPPSDAVQLPSAMAEVLTAVQAANDPRALEALVQYLLHAHPESQAAITAWVARSEQAASLAAAAPAPAPETKVAAAALAPASPQNGQGQTGPQPSTQTNASQANAAQPSATKWSGEGELGAFVSTGSAPGSGFVGRLTLVGEGRKWRVATSGRIDYQKTSDVVTRNQIRLTLEPNYKFNESGYVFGLGQYEADRFQGFTSRYSLSGGLGYNLLEEEGSKLSVRGGPAMRVTQQVEGSLERTFSAVALADLKLRLSPTLNYSQEASAYFDAVRRTFYTLAAIDSQLTGKLKARVSYTLQHETGEGDIRTLTDTSSRLTLVYGF